MRSTRAPPRPWRANSRSAASRMRMRVPAGSRVRTACRAPRRRRALATTPLPCVAPRASAVPFFATSGALERFEDAADVADRARRAGLAVGHMLERLDGDDARVAVALQRCEHGPELQFTLARPAPVRVVHLHMRDSPGRKPAVDHRGERRLLHP